ncbi:uncharacterized protein LOC121711350 isoform X5 [Alosa sapidissima]|uniref:uncharacterized protein LOC121711350 isoform X5 n=1 Tax=Alosa sapidissima TaxID=34773 RepID=UPI001C08959B|nr:uncharacterized protein LOC121711350 isoform X5 [Alosa sapidissima]
MSCLVVTIIAHLGVIQSALKVSGTELDLTIKPGNNVTLYCDCIWTQASTCPPPPDGGQCWSLLVILCPMCALLSALISSTCVYCLCRCKTAPVEPGERSKRRESRAGKQDEDKELCYASLDMPARAHKAKPKRTRNKTQNSDFSTYSEVRSYHV